jgi:predicted RNA-binding Zn-ribbon protein involved in translation (DUF1610 family)
MNGAMATIRASCPDCGDVELTTADMTVRVCSDDQRGSYAFRCPACTMAVTKSAEPRIVDLLVSSGVELQVWAVPMELREARPMGAPFSHDDLLRFHELLQEDGWLDRLVDTGGQ